VRIALLGGTGDEGLGLAMRLAKAGEEIIIGSRSAERALEAARRYAKIAPSAPHALHMPSHTFTRVGLWQESIDTNIASANAARSVGSAAEELHAMDYQAYAALQTGQDAAVRALIAALPALQARFGSLIASVILGVVWACWHLPLFFLPGTAQSKVPFVIFLLQQIPLAIFFTWVASGTRGSLLLAILLHTTVNLSGMLWMVVSDIGGAAEFPVAYIYTIGLPVTWVLAIAVVLLTSPRTLSRRDRHAGPLPEPTGQLAA
jgi:hypothetical protein